MSITNTSVEVLGQACRVVFESGFRVLTMCELETGEVTVLCPNGVDIPYEFPNRRWTVNNIEYTAYFDNARNCGVVEAFMICEDMVRKAKETREPHRDS